MSISGSMLATASPPPEWSISPCSVSRSRLSAERTWKITLQGLEQLAVINLPNFPACCRARPPEACVLRVITRSVDHLVRHELSCVGAVPVAGFEDAW